MARLEAQVVLLSPHYPAAVLRCGYAEPHTHLLGIVRCHRLDTVRILLRGQPPLSFDLT